MSTPESHVLAARDPTLVDENDWEEFGLTDVKIYALGKPRFVNLLGANEESPVRVSGVLDELEEDQDHMLLDDLYRSKRIHIDNVTHYAFGQHEDGDFGIWIAGKAGWFSITPSKQYKPIYKEVEEAIDLHYFLVDRYNRKGKKGKKSLSVDDLFEEYVRHTHGRCADAEDASEVFYNHRVFLLTHMLEDTDKNGLRSSTIFQYLCEAYPDEFEELQARINRRKEQANGELEESSESELEPNGSSISHAADERRQADVCFETLVNITESGLVPIRQLNIKTLAKVLFERYDLSSIGHANDLIRARAPLLLQLMGSTHPAGLNFAKRVIYRELQAASEEEQPQVSPTPLHERSPAPPPPSHSDEETPVIRKGHNRKSVLRPPRYSSKAAERFGNANGKRRILESEDEVSMSEQDSPSKIKPTRSQPRLSPLVSRPKQPDISSPLIREISHPDTNNKVLESPTLVEHHQSPDLTPNGPGDTWTCTVPDCAHIVPKASTKRSKGLIHDHVLTHATDAQAKLDLVFTEQRFHLPISHLVSHIQELAASRGVDSPSSAPVASPVPKRVKR